MLSLKIRARRATCAEALRVLEDQHVAERSECAHAADLLELRRHRVHRRRDVLDRAVKGSNLCRERLNLLDEGREGGLKLGGERRAGLAREARGAAGRHARTHGLHRTAHVIDQRFWLMSCNRRACATMTS